jgi:hypothetical protein
VATRQRRWRLARAFALGLMLGGVSLFAALWVLASRVAR